MAIAVPVDGAEAHQPPFVRSWDETRQALPVRPIRIPVRRALPREVHAGLPTGPLGAPFDFCGHVRRLCRDISRRSAELDHLDVSRMLIAVTQARNGQAHGLQARVTPLRFRAGQLTRERRGVTYRVQRYLVGRREILYLVTFCLPRFLDLHFDEKLVTLFHELYHVGPNFDGDLRRHNGRYSIHSHSQRAYDQHMARLARAYLRAGAEPSLYAFLRLDAAQLQRRHGSIVGIVVPRPKIIPVRCP